jgi:5-oxoprolinase (ATP-hydrolysing)
VSLSSDVMAELREYQRIATTCAAFVQPRMDHYVERLDRELAQRGFPTSSGRAPSRVPMR